MLLGLIAERPRHGYELIKAIEEKFGGMYSPKSRRHLPDTDLA